MPYEMQINAGVTGTQQLEQLGATTDKQADRTRKLDEALKQYLTSHDKLIKQQETEAGRQAQVAALKEKFFEQETAQLRKIAAAQEAASRENEKRSLAALKASQAEAAAATAAAAATRSLVPGFAATASAVDRGTASVRDMTNALKTMEGGMPLRAAARLLSSFQGISMAVSAAFPVIGAIAMIGVLKSMYGEVKGLYDNFVLLKDVQEEIGKASQQMASDFTSSAMTTNKAIEDSLKARGMAGQAAAMHQYIRASTPFSLPQLNEDKLSGLNSTQVEALKNTASELIPADISRRVSQVRDQLHSLKLDAEDWATGGGMRVGAATKQQIGILQPYYQGLEQTLLQRDRQFRWEDQAERDRDAEKQRKEASRKAEEERRKLETLRRADVGLSPTAKFASDYSALSPENQRAGMDFFGSRLIQLAGKEAAGYWKDPLKEDADATMGSAISPRLFQAQLREAIQADAEAIRQMKESVSTYDQAERGRIGTQAGTIRDTARRRGRIVAATAQPGQEMAVLQQQIALQKEAALEEYKLKAAHSDILDIEKARLEYVRETGDLDLEYTTKILELRRHQRQEFEGVAVGMFNAARSGGASRFLSGEANKVADTVVGNLAGKAWDSGLKSMIPHASGFLGSMLQGTPFGPDPGKIATDANTTATVTNTLALTNVTRALAMSSSGGGGGLVRSLAGGGSAVAAISGGVAETGYTSDGEQRYAPENYDDNGSFLGAGATSTHDPSIAPISRTMGGGKMTVAKGAGIASAAAAGAYGIYSGLHAGGAQGGLMAGGSALGSAGAIMSVLAGPAGLMHTLGPVGMLAGMGLGFLASALGDPKQHRANEISDTLKYNQFMSPVAIHASMTTAGTYSDYDRFGGIRGSGLSPFPTVEQGFFDYRRNVTVPGRTSSQFGGPVTVNINALDSKSFIDRHQDIGDALVRTLQLGHTGLQETLRNA